MLLDAKERNWGAAIYANEFYSQADLIGGVDEISVVAPVSIASVDADKLATLGTVTLVEADKPERDVDDTLVIEAVPYGAIDYNGTLEEELGISDIIYAEIT